MGIERTCVGISMLFIVAMVTDYGGISRFIPLIRHEKFLLRLAGYMIFGFTGICVMVVFFLFLEGIFVG